MAQIQRVVGMSGCVSCPKTGPDVIAVDTAHDYSCQRLSSRTLPKNRKSLYFLGIKQ